MASHADFKDRQFLAVIGDEARFGNGPLARRHRPVLLPKKKIFVLSHTGVQHITAGAEAQKNFLVVDKKTETAAIESAFESFTEQRKDIGIVLINQHIADRIRHRVDTYTAAFPTVLEIPSKDHPYDPEKDSVLRRVRRLFGE
ncbi:hypothetical protein ACHAQJ_008817 [Trichoderma viride]